MPELAPPEPLLALPVPAADARLAGAYQSGADLIHAHIMRPAAQELASRSVVGAYPRTWFQLQGMLYEMAAQHSQRLFDAEHPSEDVDVEMALGFTKIGDVMAITRATKLPSRIQMRIPLEEFEQQMRGDDPVLVTGTIEALLDSAIRAVGDSGRFETHSSLRCLDSAVKRAKSVRWHAEAALISELTAAGFQSIGNRKYTSWYLVEAALSWYRLVEAMPYFSGEREDDAAWDRMSTPEIVLMKILLSRAIYEGYSGVSEDPEMLAFIGNAQALLAITLYNDARYRESAHEAVRAAQVFARSGKSADAVADMLDNAVLNYEEAEEASPQEREGIKELQQEIEHILDASRGDGSSDAQTGKGG